MLKSYFPILTWLKTYQKSFLLPDVTAGITVGVMLIPQGMAYAMIAGLPPVFGLYAALLPQVIYALMGTSRQLAVGPVAMDSLLVAASLSALSLSGIETYITMAIFLALLMGLMQLLLGLLKMGFLVNFLSKPVISGFTSAAAIIIGLSQLKHLLGIEVAGGSQIHTLVLEIFKSLNHINGYAVAIGLGTIVLIKVIKKIHKQIPGALVVVILGIGLVYFTKLDTLGVNIVGSIPSGLPSPRLSTVKLSVIPSLIPMALTLALIAFMEAISVAKALEEKHNDYEVDANQELVALGMSNIIGSFFQSYPVSGGFGRSAVNDQAGAKTGVAAIVSALIVGLTLLFLTPLFYYLPNAVLGAIIMVAVIGLMDIKYPVQLYKNRKEEFFLLVATFLITLFIGIKEGVLLGVLLSLLLFIYRTSLPHIAILGNIENTTYFKNMERFPQETKICKNVLIIRFDAQLFFGNKDYFKKELYKNMQQKGSDLKTVIINAESINYIDSSAVFMLKKVVTDLQEKNITLLLCGAIGPVRDILHQSGLTKLIGENHFFVTTKEASDFSQHRINNTKMLKKVITQNNLTATQKR